MKCVNCGLPVGAMWNGWRHVGTSLPWTSCTSATFFMTGETREELYGLVATPYKKISVPEFETAGQDLIVLLQELTDVS